MKATSDGIFSAHHIIISAIKRPVKLPGFGTHNAIINISLFSSLVGWCLCEGQLEEGRQPRRRGERRRGTSADGSTTLHTAAAAERKGSHFSYYLLMVIRGMHYAQCQPHALQDTLLPWLQRCGQEMEKTRVLHIIKCLVSKRTASGSFQDEGEACLCFSSLPGFLKLTAFTEFLRKLLCQVVLIISAWAGKAGDAARNGKETMSCAACCFGNGQCEKCLLQ